MLVTEWKTSAETPKTQLNPTWKEIAEPVKPFLSKVAESLAQQVNEFNPEITKYVQYALSSQGKQIRPALVALSGAAFGSVNEALLKIAVIIEMVHLATLVHDDVMDEATVRRSRPTLAANWGNEISVLVGDCLFAHALALAASFPTPDVCRAVAKATNTVCTGEILQTNQRRNFHLSREDYLKALEMKTGELFALSCELGGALAGASKTEQAVLRNYGLALGTAYQLYDDCLDLFGSEKIVGKSLGTDLGTGKITLPILLILENGSNSDRLMLQNCIESLEPNDLEKIFELLLKYDALKGTQRVVYQYIKNAQRGLGQVKQSKGVDALAALGDYLAQQTEALGVN
jgi:octaprenyl-diphosphate synthase